MLTQLRTVDGTGRRRDLPKVMKQSARNNTTGPLHSPLCYRVANSQLRQGPGKRRLGRYSPSRELQLPVLSPEETRLRTPSGGVSQVDCISYIDCLVSCNITLDVGGDSDKIIG